MTANFINSKFVNIELHVIMFVMMILSFLYECVNMSSVVQEVPTMTHDVFITGNTGLNPDKPSWW